MDWRNKQPTQRQMELIRALSAHYHIPFKGTTRGEACAYITFFLGSEAKKEDKEPWAGEAIFESMWGDCILDQC